jgi:hypothetical protein
VQLVRRPRRLSERECYLRLYGTRSQLVEIVQARVARDSTPASVPEPAPDGPTGLAPALHLAIHYPRGNGTMTGEQVRAALEARMLSRPASGLPRAA